MNRTQLQNLVLYFRLAVTRPLDRASSAPQKTELDRDEAGSIRGRQLPQIRGTSLRNQHEKDSQWVVDIYGFNSGRPFRTCHVAGTNNPFEFIHGKSDSAQLRIGGIGGTTNRKTLEMVGSIIQTAHRHIAVLCNLIFGNWDCVAPMGGIL